MAKGLYVTYVATTQKNFPSIDGTVPASCTGYAIYRNEGVPKTQEDINRIIKWIEESEDATNVILTYFHPLKDVN